MALFQPSPRFRHCAARVGRRSILWGGCKKPLSSIIEIFDSFRETWERRSTTGDPPPGLYEAGCAVVSDKFLYFFGGFDGKDVYNSVHYLNSDTLAWTEIRVQNPSEQPKKKTGCGFVTYYKEGVAGLAVFAGFGKPIIPAQPEADFIPDTSTKYIGWGWTNELHLLRLSKGIRFSVTVYSFTQVQIST